MSDSTPSPEQKQWEKIALKTANVIHDYPLDAKLRGDGVPDRRREDFNMILSAIRESHAPTVSTEQPKALESNLLARAETAEAALRTILDGVDYMAGNCKVNSMVGAVLDAAVISNARLVLAAATPAQKAEFPSEQYAWSPDNQGNAVPEPGDVA